MAMFEWKELSRAWTSKEGSSGVVFIAIPSHGRIQFQKREENENGNGNENGNENEENILLNEESIYVVKSSSRIAEEIYANRLAEMVGLHVPRMRLIEYTNIEWVQIKECLQIFVDRCSASGEDFHHVQQKLRSELDRPFFLVMDFVKGQPLECNYQLPILLNSLPSRELFVRSFGFMMAFDVLINNSDRVPLVHSNEGNASNILLMETGECIPIDTCLTSIHPERSKTLLERHIQKIESLLTILSRLCNPSLAGEEKVRAERSVIERLEVIREFIFRATAYQISDEICLLIGREIMTGVSAIVRKLSAGVRTSAVETEEGMAKEGDGNDNGNEGENVGENHHETSRQLLKDLKVTIGGYVTVDWEKVWERSLELVNLDYLNSVLEVFQRFVVRQGSAGEGEEEGSK